MAYFDNNDKSLCTGCRACEQICSQNAVLFKADTEGFMYPEIDKNKCIDCGMCAKHCHMNNQNHTYKRECDVYAASVTDEKTLNSSSSGGLFFVAALEVIKNNGIVFGCAFDENFKASHIAVDNIDSLKALQGSKYVESDTENTYKEATDLLNQGREVLYSGCPCQIAGLKAFLGRDYDNLTTIDLICHGVPSQKIFNKYLGWLKIKNGADIKNYKFKSKKMGWGHYVEYTVGKISRCKKYNSDPYYYSFIACNMSRESCYKCKYATSKRVGDITLGDYWGIEIEHPEVKSHKGVSLVLVNTEKGREIFEKIKDNILFIPSTFEKASRKNGNLIKPTSRPMKRNYIYNGIDELDDVSFINKNLKIPFKHKVKGIIVKFVSYKVKVIIKRILHKAGATQT